MKHVSILVPKGDVSLSNIEGTYHILSEVNTVLKATDKASLFVIQLVGVAADINQSRGMFIIKLDLDFNEVQQTDLIIIPAVNGNQEEIIQNNAELISWIIKQHQKGAYVASFCIGAFLLASTGLLKNRPCATHWQHADKFRKMFPDVNLMDDKILMESDGIYTSGGANSYFNLVIYLIERMAGREMAILISKTFMIDIDKNSQSAFLIFKGQKDHNDSVVEVAQEYIENNYQHKLTTEKIVSTLNIGRRNFERRFKKATSNSVLEYIQRVKVEAAKKSMETTQKNIVDIMYDVGYQDVKAFREIFKKITGLAPIDYRKKYNSRNI